MILVVDDDPRILDTVELVLGTAGFDVVRAANGLEAYNHLRSPSCECMVLDLNMPQCSGTELLEVMQREYIDVPVIVMSGEAVDPATFRRHPCFAEFIRKSGDLSDLVMAVRRSVESCTPVTILTVAGTVTGGVRCRPDDLPRILDNEGTYLAVRDAAVRGHAADVQRADTLWLNVAHIVALAACHDEPLPAGE
jgi:CheY-like chemotaxis protein